MPSHVKIFAWLGFAAVVYSILSAAWVLTFPAPEMVAVMARLPAQWRAVTQHSVTTTLVVSTGAWAALSSALIWLAAFRRQNWARWSYALVFVLRKLLPFAIALAYPRFAHHELDNFIGSWSHASFYLASIPVIAAIAFVFTGNARDWFAKAKLAAA